VTQGKPEFDPAARVGMIYDTGLQQGYPEGVQVVIAHFSNAYVEWSPRNANAKTPPVAVHEDEAILLQTKRENGKDMLPNGNYIADTMQFYAINLTAGGQKVFIPMTSTQLKYGKRLLGWTQALKVPRADGSQYTPPIYYQTYNLTSMPDSNDKGSWMSWKIERGPLLKDLEGFKETLAEVVSFREAIKRGEAKGDLSGVEGESPSARDDEHSPM
jgi:hypothetical protein